MYYGQKAPLLWSIMLTQKADLYPLRTFFIVGDKLSRQLGLVQSHQQGPPIGKMPLRCACPIKVTHASIIFFRLQVHYHLNQTHFHMKVFARGLVLKQRHKVTRKWSIIEQTLGIVKICDREKNKNRVFSFVCLFFSRSAPIFLSGVFPHGTHHLCLLLTLSVRLTWKGNMESVFIASFQMRWNDRG